MFWTVPYTNDQDNFIKTLQVDRTICLLKNDMQDINNFPEFIMELSTEGSTFEFKLHWEFVANYFSNINDSFSITVSNGSPKFYYIDLTNVTGALNIKIDSKDDYCGTVSTHPLVCPITYFHGVNKKIIINETTNIYINETEYRTNKEKGFFLMFTSFASKCACDINECNINESEEEISIEKSFNFNITKTNASPRKSTCLHSCIHGEGEGWGTGRAISTRNFNLYYVVVTNF